MRLMEISMTPIAFVRGGRGETQDDDWAKERAVIELEPRFGADAIAGLGDFSHLEVVFVMDRVKDEAIQTGARHPRGRKDWPLVGIFAQRAKMRPNRVAVSRCAIEKIEGTKIYVSGLDAVDGSPVVDIKPYMRELGPRGEVRQPEWASELMRGYYVPQ